MPRGISKIKRIKTVQEFITVFSYLQDADERRMAIELSRGLTPFTRTVKARKRGEYYG